MANEVMPDMEQVIAQMRAGIFTRLMRRAQRMALIEWRDRKAMPGLAYRFTHEGNKAYSFSARSLKYNKSKGFLPDFVRTGALRDAVLARKPHSVNGGGEAVTRFKYGGLSLNFLTSKYGTAAVSHSTSRAMITVESYSRKTDKGTAIEVKGYQRSQVIHHTTRTKVTRSMADEYGDFSRDASWLRQRVGELFRDLVRTVAIRNGKLKSSYAEASDAV